MQSGSRYVFFGFAAVGSLIAAHAGAAGCRKLATRARTCDKLWLGLFPYTEIYPTFPGSGPVLGLGSASDIARLHCNLIACQIWTGVPWEFQMTYMPPTVRTRQQCFVNK